MVNMASLFLKETFINRPRHIKVIMVRFLLRKPRFDTLVSLKLRSSSYFLQQNAAILNGSISGLPLNLQVLGIGDGLTDPLSQYPGMPDVIDTTFISLTCSEGYITYATTNRYHPLVSSSVIKSANTSWTKSGGCKDQVGSLHSS